jgi:hypothetical protein
MAPVSNFEFHFSRLNQFSNAIDLSHFLPLQKFFMTYFQDIFKRLHEYHHHAQNLTSSFLKNCLAL